MAQWRLHSPDLSSRYLKLAAKPFASGAQGDVYEVSSDPNIVVKLYKDHATLRDYETKIAAMLRSAPILRPIKDPKGQSYTQIAWPIGEVRDSAGKFFGFAMPKIEPNRSTTLENILQKASRQKLGLSESYKLRVLLAANLAATISEIHAASHYMIDMKPLNVRLYLDTPYIALIDTDGFSIGGSVRIPARHCSDDYTAPEAKGRTAAELSLNQDLFALAVIIFQLLNNGIHPFTGKDPITVGYPTSRQDRIFSGLYSYGQRGHASIGPAIGSLHAFLEDSTRELFDQAFTPGSSRPKAIEWANHLLTLINDKLVPCRRNPRDHQHFSKGCGLCDLERTYQPPLGAPAPAQVGANFPNASPGPTTLPAAKPRGRKIGIAAIGVIIALIAYGVTTHVPLTAPSPPRPRTHVEVTPEGTWQPEDGYDWVNPGRQAVYWSVGKPSRLHPHVIAADTEGDWWPADGYDWVNTNLADNKAVKWVPGSALRGYAHVIAADTEGDWWPADGYDWVNTNLADNKAVKWVPGSQSREHSNVITGTTEGVWRPASGYTWVLNPPPPGDLRVKPIQPLGNKPQRNKPI